MQKSNREWKITLSALIFTHIHPICDDFHESVEDILKQSQMYEIFALDSDPIPEVRKAAASRPPGFAGHIAENLFRTKSPDLSIQ